MIDYNYIRYVKNYMELPRPRKKIWIKSEQLHELPIITIEHGVETI